MVCTISTPAYSMNTCPDNQEQVGYQESSCKKSSHHESNDKSHLKPTKDNRFESSNNIVTLDKNQPNKSDSHTSIKNKEFSINIPNDWTVIPNNVLDEYSKAIKQTTGQDQSYQYGYQSNDTENWFEYPYALVQIHKGGRIPSGELKKYKKVKQAFEEGMEKVQSSTDKLLSNMQMGETIYDESNHILWTAMSMDVANIGNVKGIIAVKLTEYGAVQFMAYGLNHNFAKYEPAYRKMINSIIINPGDEYQPQLTDNAPALFGINLGQTMKSAVIGGCIGAFIFLIGIIGNRRKNNSNSY